MNEGTSISESGAVSGSENSQVETVVTDYSEQLSIISQQQQIGICVTGLLVGLLLVLIVFNVLSRYL